MRIEIAKPYLDDQEQKAIAEVVATGWVSQGPKVVEFENIFAKYVGAKNAIAVTSCTTALHAALAVSGIGPGDEVIVPSLSFIATANSVVHCGATPVFVDIDPSTCNLDFRKVEASITRKTKAIMPVHQMGFPVDLDAVKTMADQRGLLLVEDAACAIGSTYKGKRIGGHGNLACFSFHPRKILTTGEGGMITTDNDEIADKIRRFRHHGMSISDLERHRTQKVMIERYLDVGYNYRMTDMQAAMGIVQMRKLPEILARRTAIAQRYNETFARISCIRLPSVSTNSVPNYQSYWLELLNTAPISRNDLMQRLLEKNIATRRGIMAIHQEPCYAGKQYLLPQTDHITANTVILPLYPSMTDNEIRYVIDEMVAILG